MVMIAKGKAVDFSFIPSLKCDLTCPFCMYSGGPHIEEQLDLEVTREFLETMDWSYINSCGFYGGEPVINLPLYQRFIDLVPEGIPKFMITNGTWSTSDNKYNEFVSFLDSNKLFVIVSGTPYHKAHQNEAVLETFKTRFNKLVNPATSDTFVFVVTLLQFPSDGNVCDAL